MSMLAVQLEQFAGQMRQAAKAGGSEIEFPRLALGERDSSAMLLAGTLVATTSMSGTVVTNVIGCRSFRAS